MTTVLRYAASTFVDIYKKNVSKKSFFMSIYISISYLDIFPLISRSVIVSINELTLILESIIIGQCDIKNIITLPFWGLDIYYHLYRSRSYGTRCDASDNVSLVLQTAGYSICLVNLLNFIHPRYQCKVLFNKLYQFTF